jgi:hypothetical protein
MAAGHGRNEGMKTELNSIHQRHAFALPVQHVQCSDMMERAAATCVDPSPARKQFVHFNIRDAAFFSGCI